VKFILVFAVSFILVFCRSATKFEAVNKTFADQVRIQSLVDSFKNDVGHVSLFTQKDSIRIKYSYRFFDLLSNIYMDSLRVHVDSVKVDNLTVTTQFHCNDEIALKGSLAFLKNMTKEQDSLFKFMKGLQPGKDTLISFAYLGNHQVRLPNTGDPIIKIFAFPIPLSKATH
jgi:hypothetical protein